MFSFIFSSLINSCKITFVVYITYVIDSKDRSTAARLAGLIAEIGDADAIVPVGDWIVDSPTGNELIARFGNGS